MLQRLKNFLIGEPLTHDNSSDDHLLSKVQALAMLSSDALSSIAYGPEQVALVLMAVSSAAIWLPFQLPQVQMPLPQPFHYFTPIIFKSQ